MISVLMLQMRAVLDQETKYFSREFLATTKQQHRVWKLKGIVFAFSFVFACSIFTNLLAKETREKWTKM
jgi:hypothetical protein